jgi:hypothetical protein
MVAPDGPEAALKDRICVVCVRGVVWLAGLCLASKITITDDNGTYQAKSF